MMRALELDGEKLRGLTGEDHGPWYIFDFEENEMSEWKPIAEAPKDGTWILLRGRNMAGQPMVPVVAAFKPVGAAHHGDSWVDSRGFENCDSLAADQGADWHPLPL